MNFESPQDGELEGAPRPIAAVPGTTIAVEDLFYNVPTRRKALRSAAEEYAAVVDIVSRYAVRGPACLLALYASYVWLPIGVCGVSHVLLNLLLRALCRDPRCASRVHVFVFVL